MSREEVGEKCSDLIAEVTDARRAGALLDRIWALDRVSDVSELRPLLAG